jgi:anthranilate phosphoribosyltransferase
MKTPSQCLNQLLNGEDLSEAEAADLMQTMASGELAPALAGGLLIALRTKGETAAEIRGFATMMRKLSIQPNLPSELVEAGPCVDIVGTGGDGSKSLNLSTGAALVTAAAGVTVIKHGNRAVSSDSGSADVLAALGLSVPLDEAQVVASLAKLNFTFLFAPSYHPAMKHIAPVRAALGVRTLFNILGPLANPAQPDFAVIGAFSVQMAELMANTLSGMAMQRAFVIHGEPGWDEATPVGPFDLFEVTPGAVTHRVVDPLNFGLPRCTADDLKGGDSAYNAARLAAVLNGNETGSHRDALVLGAALALEVTGIASDLAGGIAMANAALDQGAGKQLLIKMQQLDNLDAHG